MKQLSLTLVILMWGQTLVASGPVPSEPESAQEAYEREESPYGDRQPTQPRHPSLEGLLEARAEATREVLTRYHAAATVSAAEAYFREAMAQADAGDDDAAAESAARARAFYRRARLEGIGRGPIRDLRSRVSYFSPRLAPEDREEARRILADLESALDDAQSGETTVSALRARVGLGAGRISGLLDFDPIRPIDPDFGVGPGQGFHPDTFAPPRPPVTMRITGRGPASLTVTWKDASDFEELNQLEVQKDGGPWELEAEWGPRTGFTEHTATSLDPDTLYCFRIRVENSFGARITAPADRACGYTRDADGLPVWRLQLRVRTADVESAGTDNPVRVRLNSPLVTYAPSGNGTWMDYGPRPLGGIVFQDDFARGSEFTYDLGNRAVRTIGDVTMVSLLKEGSNALAIASLSLLVNGVVVFDRQFGETAETAQWIDDGDGFSPIFTIFHPELRAHPAWQAYLADPPGPPFTIPNAEVASRLEGIVGDSIHGNEAYWGHLHGDAWVEASKASDDRLHVDLDLAIDAPGFDPELDIDFDLDLDVSCSADTVTLSITTSNLESGVDFNLLTEVLSLGLIELVEDEIADEIEKAWEPITQRIAVQSGGICPTVQVTDAGDITFGI